ncbi:hypothetical protein [uncultured Gammaproteobacteria bacterium]|nr:hypothetical protein [uncultured Gammaproteobacteria bacterium]
MQEFFTDLNNDISKINEPVIRTGQLTYSNILKNDAIQMIELSLKPSPFLDFLKNDKSG